MTTLLFWYFANFVLFFMLRYWFVSRCDKFKKQIKEMTNHIRAVSTVHIGSKLYLIDDTTKCIIATGESIDDLLAKATKENKDDIFIVDDDEVVFDEFRIQI